MEKYRARAEAVADEVQPTELRELLYYLVDSVLDRQPPPEPGAVPFTQGVALGYRIPPLSGPAHPPA